MARGTGRRGASARRLSPSSSSSSCHCPFCASSSGSCQAPGQRRCRRRRRRGLPAPPSRPRRKWTASPGNRCARRRGRSAPKARRNSAARAASRSCTPCLSSKVTSEGAAGAASAGAPHAPAEPFPPGALSCLAGARNVSRVLQDALAPPLPLIPTGSKLRILLLFLLLFLIPLNSSHLSGGQQPYPPARSLTCRCDWNVPRASCEIVLPSSPRLVFSILL